jgi:hypothetical protein
LQHYNEIYGFIALAISIAGSSVYISSILRGNTKPHIYTHLVWGIVTTIAFLAQLQGNAGPGSWAIGATAAACLTQAALALKYGEKDITRSDKIALAASLATVAAWLCAEDALLSVILASVVDVIAFYPTFRKSWRKPWQENLASYNIANLKLALSLVALTQFTPVTALYPLAGFTINLIFVISCLARRSYMARRSALL